MTCKLAQHVRRTRLEEQDVPANDGIKALGKIHVRRIAFAEDYIGHSSLLGSAGRSGNCRRRCIATDDFAGAPD
jgi:hypothetical protein